MELATENSLKQVVAAAVIKDNRLLLLRKREYPELWLLPGGSVLAEDEGEVSALRRKLAAELHLRPDSLRLQKLTWFSGQGVSEPIELHLYRLDEPDLPMLMNGEMLNTAWLNALEVLHGRYRMTEATVKAIEYLNTVGLI